ncbi:VCBS repeat-containing protein [Rhodocytophaga aerolata]|uniref:VCBS repeat-containing protein n=1 Tax=Rhodocytophaga aerolata TaxID=455078 RepID=A0ABT8R1Z0_9BACT|nr:VCBS repeat-containing protein [Rhodocytophaga aerolata]MDO1446114.1 VCBS repeat-containing protein [Rhodocytophaga aerolata]
MKYVVVSLLVAIILPACKDKPQENTLFESISSSKTNIHFANTITTNDSLNALSFDYIYNGGGVAIGDINNDSLPDIYFTGNQVSGKLYLNKGNFEFEDITSQAGVTTDRWATGVSMIDINADGFLDIYICVAGRDTSRSSNLLFINNGNQTFSEKAREFGLADTGYSTHAAFLDYDKDGDLDMYLLTNGYESYARNNARPKMLKGESITTDRLYRNNGNNTFTNVSKEAGILVEGYGLGVAVSDINQDGWPDIYVANDFITNDILWINNGNGTFTDKAAQALKHQSHNGMGTDVADFNNDGLVDIVVLDMLPEDNLRQKSMFPSVKYDRFAMNLQYGYLPQYVRNTLQLNNGNGTFSEIGQLAGIHNTDWSWSALFADYDNDGYKDLFVTNGYRKDVTDLDFVTYSRENAMFGTDEVIRQKNVKELEKLKGAHVHNYIFQNKGDLTFSDQSTQWGMAEPTYSNGAAYADLDKDGDLDLVINNIDSEASVYRNNTDLYLKNNYLQILLQGDAPNKAGLGTKIRLFHKGQQQYQECYPYRGYKSTVYTPIHFGLGNQTNVDSIEIQWPDGKYQLLKNIKANQQLVVAYTEAKQLPAPFEKKQSQATLFTDVSQHIGIDFKHKESGFVDFKVQPLLPHKFSQNGPGIAVGDADGNGLDDFYVGGAARQSGMLFYQTSKGKFEGKPMSMKEEEDMGSLFFDADNDGDLDLYVVSGGSEFGTTSPNYQDRLYKNDGKGNYSIDSTALPNITASGSCVTAADYDKDGDLDLFVGGRIVPARYPLAAQSYILQNTNGKFRDVTAEVGKEIQSVGLVTTALWTDFDNDSQTDLLVAGEWMPVRFFKNINGKFIAWNADEGKIDSSSNDYTAQSKTPITHSYGWWNSLAAGDFDNDGDIDYIAGNLGLNSKYKASPTEPVCVYAKDYDKNGSFDPVFCYYIMGKNYPTHPRDAMIEQMNGIRGRFTRYEAYGKATFDQVFTKDELADAYVVRSENFASSYLENAGNGKFNIKSLPVQAQFAPVFGMVVDDIDKDGNLDVLMAGNSYATEVQTGWYDASIGVYLKGDGKGNFTLQPVTKTGFNISKDAKSMVHLPTSDGSSLVLISCNNDSLKAFTSAIPNQQQLSIKLSPSEVYGEITYKGGRTRKEEFYFGSSYLSQSSRIWQVPADAQVTIYDVYGKSRRFGGTPSVSMK